MSPETGSCPVKPAATSDRFGCYTTARVSGGRVERVERHVRRLRRDAARLGLPMPDARDVEALFLATARDGIGRGDGIVRIEWSAAFGDAPELIATHRGLGADPRTWRAVVSRACHPGPEARRNTKFVHVDVYDAGRLEAQTRSVDEVLIFDAAGHLVEGAHSNCLVVDAGGRLVTPAANLGGVEGLGLSIVRENQPEIREATLTLEDLRAARELMGVNAVRGVVPILEFDGRPIGGGRTGPWAERLRKIFFRD